MRPRFIVHSNPIKINTNTERTVDRASLFIERVVLETTRLGEHFHVISSREEYNIVEEYSIVVYKQLTTTTISFICMTTTKDSIAKAT